MAKTSSINSRIEPELKAQAEAIFAELGLSTSDAITLFFKQVSMHNGLPFEVKIPNAETIQALTEIESGKPLQRYNNFQELLDDVGNDDALDE